MTSTSRRDGAFGWVWLPGFTEPVVSGRIRRVGERYDFAYGRSYLGRAEVAACTAQSFRCARAGSSLATAWTLLRRYATQGQTPGGSASSWTACSASVAPKQILATQII